ncbi:hypothetical protein L195_g016580 [Trifolium pratense]|uniref:Uncharacterized protein n=1 Tax=Trifolium pratense TaxID=57577 RepID=A0A2K3M888_TRIPR|nr:hypothetical protein L195_g043090 [Trifolium pratense]PNX89026.1 hypothetical protein L195_g045143 [Trifolium pratense]PNX93426.1 hypothetical protein L195_g016580 [Trifolium pratense]
MKQRTKTQIRSLKPPPSIVNQTNDEEPEETTTEEDENTLDQFNCQKERGFGQPQMGETVVRP